MNKQMETGWKQICCVTTEDVYPLEPTQNMYSKLQLCHLPLKLLKSSTIGSLVFPTHIVHSDSQLRHIKNRLSIFCPFISLYSYKNLICDWLSSLVINLPSPLPVYC